MIKRSLWILALSASLAACSSGVKLSEVPVEDKNASAAAVAPVASSEAAVAALTMNSSRQLLKSLFVQGLVLLHCCSAN